MIRASPNGGFNQGQFQVSSYQKGTGYPISGSNNIRVMGLYEVYASLL